MIKTGKIFLVKLTFYCRNQTKRKSEFTEPIMQRSEKKAVCVCCAVTNPTCQEELVYLDGEDRRNLGKEGGAGHAGPSQQF